jgi:hypothetical protein
MTDAAQRKIVHALDRVRTATQGMMVGATTVGALFAAPDSARWVAGIIVAVLMLRFCPPEPRQDGEDGEDTAAAIGDQADVR